MSNGTVKFFNAAKGFGFITPDDGGKDVFVPATSITASGIAKLKAGQRVAFDSEPDAKGPKAVNLKLLAEPVRDIPRETKEPRAQAKPAISLYCDSDSDDAQDVLAALRDLGHEPHLVDVITAPPSREELKTLSLLMREADQSLVRRYDRLFLELQLDDRFISENEFWTGIFEHPTLINGPVLANANKARLCRTPQDVKAFLGADAAAGKPKGLSPRIAAMMTGGVVPPPEPKEHIAPAISQKPAPAFLPKQGQPKAKIEPRKTPKLAADMAPPKTAAAKTAVKKAAAKPVKKAAPAKKTVKKKK